MLGVPSRWILTFFRHDATKTLCGLRVGGDYGVSARDARSVGKVESLTRGQGSVLLQ